jgi:transposase
LRGVRSQDLYTEMHGILQRTKLLYIDETGWKKDGFPCWLWCFCNSIIAFYHIEDSRGGKVLKAVLGDKFNGIIISDFLAAYNAIESKKQKCLPHALRIIKRLEDSSCGDDKEVDEFCRQLKEIIKEIIHLFKKRKSISDYVIHRGDVIARCKKLLSKELSHNKAERLRRKFNTHREELYTCLFHPTSDFNNNFVERMLRPNVIMRKLTYGNRSQKGIKNHSVVTSLLQTAKLNNHYTPDIFHRLLTNPSQFNLNNLIRAP